MEFQGKTLLITGAAGNIGKAVIKELYKEGANVALVDINPAALEAAAKELGLAPERSLLIAADVSKEEDAERYVKETVERFGGIDVFHNNAGINGVRYKIEDINIEQFRHVVDVNVYGVALGLKYVMRQMRKQGHGSIINTSSHVAKLPMPNSTDYSVTKTAVVMLTKIAAQEMRGTGVRINCVMPGIIHSEMIMRNYMRDNPGSTEAEAVAGFSKNIPIGRWCELEEVASVVKFLAGEGSSYITGAAIPIDGGTTANQY